MPRVAMVIQRYLPHVGGAERQLQQLIPRLRERGYEVSIFTRHEKGLPRDEIIDGVPVHRQPSPGPKALAGLTFTVATVLSLRRFRPDLVHAHEILTPASIAVWSKRLQKHPVVVKILRGGARGDIFKLKRRPLWSSYFNTLKRQVDTFIVISHEIDGELAALGVPKEKRIMLPNGVDTARCTPISEEHKLKLRTQLSIPPHAITVVYAGRLVPEKRVDHLLRIWRNVHAIHPNAHLFILGEGPEAEMLHQMPAKAVHFTGQVDDAVPYLQAADLFVLPSSTEGLSNAMLEAMACGLPVLATSVGGAPDVIEHKVSGYLIPPDDVEALQLSLEALVGAGALRLKIGSNARARIVADFSLETLADRLAALYERLLHPPT